MVIKDRERLAQGMDHGTPLRAYWERYAHAFASPLSANGLLGSFVTNPAVTGAYAEAWIQRLVETTITGLKISTGAVIRTSDVLKQRDLKTVPQSDLILWDPSEMPALFQSGNFALVHTQAARAIIEVKRTVPDLGDFQSQLRKQRFRLLPEYRRQVLGVVIASGRNLFGGDVNPEWVTQSDPKADVRMTRLLNRKSLEPDVDGVFALIYFLSHVARSGRTNAA